MSKQELRKWCDEHIKIPHRYVYNSDNGYKMEFENGDTYEYRIIMWKVNRKIFHVFINGVKECEIINGVYV